TPQDEHGPHPQRAADDKQRQAEITHRVAIYRPDITAVGVRRQPAEEEPDDQERQEDPSILGILAPAARYVAAGDHRSDRDDHDRDDGGGPRGVRHARPPAAPTPDREPDVKR